MATRLRHGVASVNWPGIATLVVLLVLWQLLVSTKIINYAPLPGPIEIWSGLKYLAGSGGGLWSDVGHTMHCVALAWVIAVVVGGLVGMVVALNATVASWAGSTVDLLRSLPVIALIPVAILIWGIGSKTEIILGAYAGMWPMLMNTAGGARSVPARLHDVARTLRLSRRATLQKIVMPATGAAMLVGARLALATTLVLCVVAEMLGLESGVGHAVVLEGSGDEPARMWAYVLVIGSLGILVNFALVRIVRVLFPGVTAASERSLG
ncbi:MAG TPA: ABC transporter permease subunit [Solirubrobacteraceae bacterium]|jgi:ABC-type nitrate/sulfonate/bicarbonate transport system permease component|nr:ABC transporter permease subunit [Solirubrobacteraceae bacterium]